VLNYSSETEIYVFNWDRGNLKSEEYHFLTIRNNIKKLNSFFTCGVATYFFAIATQNLSFSFFLLVS